MGKMKKYAKAQIRFMYQRYIAAKWLYKDDEGKYYIRRNGYKEVKIDEYGFYIYL